jgi:hypothetical protein
MTSLYRDNILVIRCKKNCAKDRVFAVYGRALPGHE